MQPVSNLTKFPEDVFSIIVQNLPPKARGQLRQASSVYYNHKMLQEKDDWLNSNSMASGVIKKFLFKNGINSIPELLTNKIKNSVTHLELCALEIPEELKKNDKWLTKILKSFANIKKLSIFGSKIIQPETFKAFPKSLEVLECTYCDLNDDSIKAMVHFKNLKELNVCGNPKLTGKTFKKLPESIKKLTAIDYSVLDLNDIPSCFDKILEKLTKFCNKRNLQ